MLAIHPQAHTTPAVRAEIARSPESSSVLAKRYGVSTEIIRKWHKRGPDVCQDRSARPHKPSWRASDEERAIVCTLRRSTGFPIDALTFVISHFLPRLNRDTVYRILRAEGLNRLCRVLGVSPSGYFAWTSCPTSTRQRENLELLTRVRPAFGISHETYGSPRITHELREQALAAGRRRVARLMRENGIGAYQPRRFQRTTDSGHTLQIGPYHLNQDFTALGPDRMWGANISYVWTCEGSLYLAGGSTFTHNTLIYTKQNNYLAAASMQLIFIKDA